MDIPKLSVTVITFNEEKIFSKDSKDKQNKNNKNLCYKF